jgi:hypothetical protein
MYGIADYSNPAASVVHVKINNFKSRDIYVTYNRMSGLNSGTKDAQNHVTVTCQYGKGTDYGESP